MTSTVQATLFHCDFITKLVDEERRTTLGHNHVLTPGTPPETYLAETRIAPSTSIGQDEELQATPAARYPKSSLPKGLKYHQKTCISGYTYLFTDA